ncbi:MAG TPA: Ni/Fe-hydrogenase, b-type cytochrome subunit [Gemmatimonadota bacterium]
MSARTHTEDRAGPTGRVTKGPGDEYRWVYLWHWPIRAMHWIAAASILVLVVTGFYIGRPYFMTWGEASSHYLMGWMRFLHFTAAGVLVATGIVRVYWLFAGNRFERWPALFPIRRKDWVNLGRMVRHYLMIGRGEGPQYLGHNPLQQLSYTGIYLVTIVMVLTGFALYGQANPGGLISSLFGWIPPLVGGVQMTRFIHHILTWVFVIFVPLHVYLSLRVDLLERTGTISSIVSGGRFRPTGRKFEDEE